MIVNCKQCTLEYKTSPRTLKRCKNNFCSRQCKSAYELKQVDIQCVICSTVFQVIACYKNRYSTCSEKCKRANRKREKNANWQGGVTKPRKADMSSKEYKEWRKSVFLRDNYTCVFCSNRGGELNADHIKPWAFFPNLRYDVNNGRTLCLKCHKLTYKDNLKWRTNKQDGMDVTSMEP